MGKTYKDSAKHGNISIVRRNGPAHPKGNPVKNGKISNNWMTRKDSPKMPRE